MVIDNKNRIFLIISMLLLLCIMSITSYAEETTIETTAVTGGGGQTSGGGAGREDVLNDRELKKYIPMLLTKSWEMFQIKFPGTKLSVGSISISVIIVAISIKLIHFVMGTTQTYLVGNAMYEARKKYTAKGREHDEK